MYTPRHNREEDPAKIVAFLRENTFATLVTTRDGAITATHLPFVVEDESGEVALRAHMARMNPQWRDFGGGGEALVIFQGPHAYVSPSNYELFPSVPTWNYVAVHAYGIPVIVDDPERKHALLGRLVAQHDENWMQSFEALPPDYTSRKLDAIVAFEILAPRLEARYKLSQDRTPAERENVARALDASGDEAAVRVAGLMERRGE